MQAGFACLEVGAVRTKNAVNILMKNLLDMVICCFAYYMVGYPLAYGEGNPFIGYQHFAGVGLPDSAYVDWFFQFIFAATTATIVSGAVAERCQFAAYLIYSAVISGFVYPVVSHWAWSKHGWLNTLGFHDLSGCGVVHALAGTCAFVAAALLGPRKGRFDEKGKPQDMGGHSLPITGIGALLLFTGFLAFNGGAIFHITGKGDDILVARSMINTIIAGCGGSLLTLVMAKLHLLESESPWPFTLILNGTLAGMASSCAAPHKYAAWAMFIIGMISALCYQYLHRLILFLKVDDPLDATALHFAGGSWGMLAEGFFQPEGLLYKWSYESGMEIVYNTVGLLAIILWGAVWSICLFGGLKCFGLLRVSEREELEGLDKKEHGEEAYPRAAWGDNGYMWTVRPSTVISNPPKISFDKLYPEKKSKPETPPYRIEPQPIWNYEVV
uniref:Ammonium transporter n=1 Tax=Lygus hesperus TaxID=30085 RepID=A0A146MH48_LYGHE